MDRATLCPPAASRAVSGRTPAERPALPKSVVAYPEGVSATRCRIPRPARRVELFVAVLGASNLTYAEATATRQLDLVVALFRRLAVDVRGGNLRVRAREGCRPCVAGEP